MAFFQSAVGVLQHPEDAKNGAYDRINLSDLN